MFDLLQGLPVHPLVVHAVVVLLPLVALGTVAVTTVPRWRRLLVWWVGADAVALVLSFVAKESGETLQRRLSQAAGHPIAHDHAEQGDLIPVIAFALLATAAVAYWLVGRLPVGDPTPGSRRAVAVVLVAVAALGTVGWTVAVGHTGAVAVWKEQIANTATPTGD